MGDMSKGYEFYYAKYEFAAAFSAKYIVVRTWQNMQPKNLEGSVFYDFIQMFGSLPITNGKADGDVWSMLKDKY